MAAGPRPGPPGGGQGQVVAAPWVLVLAAAVGEGEAGTGGAGWLLKPEAGAGGGVLEGVPHPIGARRRPPSRPHR